MIFLEDLDVYTYRLGLPKWIAIFMIFLYPATWAIGIYRFGNWVWKRCDIFILKQVLFGLYFILKRITEILTNIEIYHKAEIGKGLFIGHMGGIVIGSAKIGEYSFINQGVTIGGAGRGKKFGFPSIGDYTYFGAGSKVIGKIKIGNSVAIGANAVVIKNIPDNAVVVGIPADIISFKGTDDFIYYRF